MPGTVLVTGGTGFVGGWTVAELVRRGYRVRTTVRDPSRADAVRAAIGAAEISRDPDRPSSAGEAPVSRGGARRCSDAGAGHTAEVVVADLLADDGWAAAVAGCDAVVHVAASLTPSRDERDLVAPAVDGTLRVLRAARDAGVRRVVYTSSCAAVYYGHRPREAAFTEADWTDLRGARVSSYVKAKTLAERAAWDWVAERGDAPELVTVNPTAVFGPALTAAAGSSLGLIRRLLAGRPRLVPDLRLCIVDVRDVVDLHLRALEAPDAAGGRFIANGSEPIPLPAVARELRARLGERATRVPTRPAPEPLVRIVGRLSPQVASLVPLLGNPRRASWERAAAQLGWAPRPWQDAVVASAESLLAHREHRMATPERR